ncbi:hypothetical protein OEZ85_005360 [Tetradesmus obliquus]|uniref:Uncharacterized protein n=1 Tax=Tetradesmus obliquus TaxID=3088 RepID=A0ABY8UL49_TETOB|nr:hypothetical protein OEZ85_005360 [Tetradesmus obliquus]
MHTAPVQVTVVEYVSEFFRKYKSRAYGKSISVNAKGGADALMGMLKLVLSKGGREELRIALHCFKDQLTAAVNSAPATRSQQVEELFALLSALVDAAERLRQFSPVKEGLSAAVLEEVRWRLFRVLAGDGFSEAPDVRRRALDLVFLSHMREAAELQQQQQRHKQLVAGGAAAAAGPAAGIAAGIAAANAAAAGFTGGGSSGKPGSPSKAARLLQRRAGGLAGPDVSSWEGLWCSLGAMSGRRMLPLLQSVMANLRFAAKFGRLRESVKESVSIGGGNGSGSGSGGAAWKLPRAWVQQLRHGHDKERDKEQQQQQQQQVSDVELDQQQSVDDDHAAGSGGSSSSRVEQQQGVQCVAPLPAASLAAAASQ